MGSFHDYVPFSFRHNPTSDLSRAGAPYRSSPDQAIRPPRDKLGGTLEVLRKRNKPTRPGQPPPGNIVFRRNTFSQSREPVEIRSGLQCRSQNSSRTHTNAVISVVKANSHHGAVAQRWTVFKRVIPGTLRKFRGSYPIRSNRINETEPPGRVFLCNSIESNSLQSNSKRDRTS